MICKEEHLDADYLPPPPFPPTPPSPLRGPGLLPRWEEVRSAHAKQKSDRDFSRKQETWMSYLERSPCPLPLPAFT